MIDNEVLMKEKVKPTLSISVQPRFDYYANRLQSSVELYNVALLRANPVPLASSARYNRIMTIKQHLSVAQERERV